MFLCPVSTNPKLHPQSLPKIEWWKSIFPSKKGSESE